MEIETEIRREAEDLARKIHGKPTRAEILRDAANIVSRDRQEMYGDPAIMYGAYGEIVNILSRVKNPRVSEAEFGLLLMVIMKAVRATTSPKLNADTYVDGSGYFGLAGEVASR
jgi:hypothetical protein